MLGLLLVSSGLPLSVSKNLAHGHTVVTATKVKTMTGSNVSYVNVTAIEAKTMIESEPSLVVLDVSNQSEYVTGHIRNAKLIPLYELSTRLNELNKSDEILVYCRVGGRSASASQILESDGFLHIYNVLGGITDWVRLGYPAYVNYASIQEAIDNATAGETIYVASGLYQEHLYVNKSIALVGENRDTTTVDGTGNGTLFEVTADNVSISDFTIINSGCGCKGYCAVHVDGYARTYQNINITHNCISSNGMGIKLNTASRVVLAYNNITDNTAEPVIILNSSSVLVLENNIQHENDGIEILTSTDNVLCSNTIFNVNDGISLEDSSNNTIYGNTISNDIYYGFYVSRSSNNSIFENNLLENEIQAFSSNDSINSWDNGFEGNYWSDYTGADTNHTGTGKTPQTMRSNIKDAYPLMGTFHIFHTSSNYDLSVVSNSTIDRLDCLAPGGSIELQVSNATANQTYGFCRIGIPHALIDPLNGSINVIIDNGQTPVTFLNGTLYDNGTYRWIYFSYPQSTHQIVIIPEFSPTLILPLLVPATVLATLLYRRRHARTH
jgi:parallel beta-helix repeat protein